MPSSRSKVLNHGCVGDAVDIQDLLDSSQGLAGDVDVSRQAWRWLLPEVQSAGESEEP